MTRICILIQITYKRITVCFAAIRPGGTNLEILYSECYTIPAEHGTIKGNRL